MLPGKPEIKGKSASQFKVLAQDVRIFRQAGFKGQRAAFRRKGNLEGHFNVDDDRYGRSPGQFAGDAHLRQSEQPDFKLGA